MLSGVERHKRQELDEWVILGNLFNNSTTSIHGM